MKTKSHLLLGKYIADGIGDYSRKIQRWAFILGCVEPDYNYITYLKGSISKKLFSGHTYESAQRYMSKLIKRLQSKVKLSSRDYYRLGKLLHYVVDSFTYAHNVNFEGSLPEHREYELRMKEKFSDYLESRKPTHMTTKRPLLDLIKDEHARYMRMPASEQKDMSFVEQLSLIIYSTFAPVPA